MAERREPETPSILIETYVQLGSSSSSWILTPRFNQRLVHGRSKFETVVVIKRMQEREKEREKDVIIGVPRLFRFESKRESVDR